jgi:iron complex outermembrane receptor protein
LSRMNNNEWRRPTARAALQLATLFGLLAACCFCLTGSAATQDSIPFSIPSGPIQTTLTEFALQAHFSVAADPATLENVTTRTVSGRYTATGALEQMLAGTGLTFELIADKSVFIRRAPQLRPADAPVGPTPILVFPKQLQTEVITIEGGRPGKNPAGSDTFSLDRTTLDMMPGETVEDILQSRPDIFGGGPTQDTTKGLEATANSSRGSGINLRGLDAGATLVLVNGCRIAPSGEDGGYEDISNIPLSAIERIEITPEGAAIRYGTDAPGGVVDLIMRDDYVGKEAEASGGATTDGDVRQHRYSIVLGTRTNTWGDGIVTVALEDYSRSALFASDRSQATSNLGAFGGQNFDTPFGNPGTIVVGSQTWAIPHGQNGVGLSATTLVPGTQNFADQFEGATVLPAEHRSDGLISIHDALENGVKLFAGAFLGKRSVESRVAPVSATLTIPNSNPYYVNPTGGTDPVDVEYGFGPDLGPQITRGDVITRNFTAGVDVALHDWVLTAYAGYSEDSEDLATFNEVNFAALQGALTENTADQAFNAFGDGSHTDPDVLASIRGQDISQTRSRLSFAHWSAMGPTLSLPAGALELEVGLEYRRQTFDTLATEVGVPQPIVENLGRQVASAYTQLQIPIFSAPLGSVWTDKIEGTAAFRTDRYSDVGTTSNPTFGFVWTLTEDFSLRGTWARAFRPPDLPDRVAVDSYSGIVALPDRASQTGTTQTLVWSGDNSSLRPEKARTWTMGVNWKLPTLHWLPDASVDLTFFDVSFDDRIDDAVLEANALSDPAMVDRVIRDPTAALRAQVCNGSQFQGDPLDCLDLPVGAVLDLRLRNIDILKTRGLDLLARSDQYTPIGELGLRLEGTYLLRYSEALGPDAPLVNLLNTETNPINLRLRGSANWRLRSWNAEAAVNFANAYRDTASVPPRRINSWITTDLSVGYLLRNPLFTRAPATELFLKIENVFNQLPPFVNNQITHIGYDQENGDLLGRMATIGIRVNW